MEKMIEEYKAAIEFFGLQEYDNKNIVTKLSESDLKKIYEDNKAFNPSIAKKHYAFLNNYIYMNKVFDKIESDYFSGVKFDIGKVYLSNECVKFYNSSEIINTTFKELFRKLKVYRNKLILDLASNVEKGESIDEVINSFKNKITLEYKDFIEFMINEMKRDLKPTLLSYNYLYSITSASLLMTEIYNYNIKLRKKTELLDNYLSYKSAMANSDYFKDIADKDYSEMLTTKDFNRFMELYTEAMNKLEGEKVENKKR